jgi:hypothetical protein
MFMMIMMFQIGKATNRIQLIYCRAVCSRMPRSLSVNISHESPLVTLELNHLVS